MGRSKGQAMERTNGVTFKLTTKHLQFPLLGSCCEKRMKAWEDVVKHVVHHAEGRFPARSALEGALLNEEAGYSEAEVSKLIDPAVLSKFGCSVVWRAHASGKLGVDLGALGEVFRDALLGDRVVPDVYCIVEVLADERGPFADARGTLVEP